jgi:hypothetical protein
MIKAYYLPIIQWRNLSPLFYLSTGALFGFVLTAFVLSIRSEQKGTEVLREFGTAMTKLAAKQAVQASISHDLVSMHAIMQDIQSQFRVLMVTVHDLEENLLVQAGQPNPYAKTLAFSEPIPLHDSVTGIVTLTLDAEFDGESAVGWTLLGTAFLLMIMAVLAFWEGRGEAWSIRRVALAATVLESAPVDVDPDTEEETEYPEAVLTHSDLIMVTSNRARLEKQLSSSLFESMVADFDRCLDDVLTLYGGVRVGTSTGAGIYCFRFASSESTSEAAFRAVCCAYLVEQMNQRHKIRFTLLAEVCHPESDVKLVVGETGIFIQSSLWDELFDARTEVKDIDEHRMSLSSFKAPFSSLLNRQRDQLLGI